MSSVKMKVTSSRLSRVLVQEHEEVCAISESVVRARKSELKKTLAGLRLKYTVFAPPEVCLIKIELKAGTHSQRSRVPG